MAEESGTKVSRVRIQKLMRKWEGDFVCPLKGSEGKFKQPNDSGRKVIAK